MKSELMNNDGVSSITCTQDYHMAKFLRFLPAGQTEHGFRARPLIQFYRDHYVWKGHVGYGFQHTIAPEDIVSVKGMTDEQLRKKIHRVRVQHGEIKPEKVRRRSKLK